MKKSVLSLSLLVGYEKLNYSIKRTDRSIYTGNTLCK